jgi:hypothetical protein
LPWWWNHYSKHNSHPVAFVDLGMSFEKKQWCKNHGELIPLRVADFAAEEHEIDPALTHYWDEGFGKTLWDERRAWFKKPLACLKSPFDQTIWIDVDCEVRGSLSPLFGKSFAIAKDFLQYQPDYPIYNSGVISFSQNHPLLQKWAEWCMQKNHLFRCDQEILSHLIVQHHKVEELPPEYNWTRCQGDNPNAIVYHWIGPKGKTLIRHQIWMESL